MKNTKPTGESKMSLSPENKTNFTNKKLEIVESPAEQDKRSRSMKSLMGPLRIFLIELDKSVQDIPLYNEVMNENIQNGFKGRYPALSIDYTKLIVSKGNLPNPEDLSVHFRKPGKLIFHWTNNSGMHESRPSDLLFIGVTPRKSQCWMAHTKVAKRSTCRYSMDVSTFQGMSVYVYAAFISEDGERISTSLFLGEVKVF